MQAPVTLALRRRDAAILEIFKESEANTIEVTADSGGKVSESDESNNTLLRTLPTIIDPTPPDMTGSIPSDGAFVQTVNQVRFTLVDQYGVVDDAAVIASVAVLGGGQPLSGTVLESNDQFTFVPETAPLPDGVYQVALTAADVSGNTQAYSFVFTVDQQPPAAPFITGGTVATGGIERGVCRGCPSCCRATLLRASRRVWRAGCRKSPRR